MPPQRRNIGPLRTAIDRQGRGSVPARFFGVGGYAGADRCVGPDMVPRGARPRADTWVYPYAREYSGANGNLCGKRTLSQRGGTEPAPYEGSGQASGREGWAGIGAKTIPNGGPPRNLPGSALSAERAAGQIRSLPDDIRVQHGVQRLEVSAKPRPCLR